MDSSLTDFNPGEAFMNEPTQKDKNDESIMNTNSSCIVSKRSVEKTYHDEDHGFLRHFVKRFQRRSPLINRGYWLRMRAVTNSVQTFLQENKDQPSVVVNLGCGYDTIPFKFLSRDSKLCEKARFVDVDYEKLLRKKCEVIKETRALYGLCKDAKEDVSEPHVLFESQQYMAIAADLHWLGDLQDLQQAMKINDRPVLFIAEVSMTYMDPDAVGNTIRWASSFKQAEFVLLEQVIPDGKSNQFAFTMINHFNKLQSPLKSALRYPTLADQEKRFQDNGFSSADARTLWSLWEDDLFLDRNERRVLDSVEPFDEWEEFMLFAAHYFVLKAKVRLGSEAASQPTTTDGDNNATIDLSKSDRKITGKFHPSPQIHGLRRHGASAVLSPSEILHHGGYGPKSRLGNGDTYVRHFRDESIASGASTPKQYFTHEVVCHSLTRMKNGNSLLVGGRRSPDQAVQACFLESRGAWTRVEDLPEGRYRHAAVPFEEGVLIIGGKRDSTNLVNDWLYWENYKGWNRVNFIGDQPSARFGASASKVPVEFTRAPGPQSSVLLAGGMGHLRRVHTDVWQIDLIFMAPNGSPVVRCWQPTLKQEGKEVRIGGFGGRMVEHNGDVWLVGGISNLGYCPHSDELVRIDKDYEVSNFQIAAPDGESIPRPLLVGHQVTSVDKDSLLIFGGGATCFSFGTSWNRGLYSITTTADAKPTDSWELIPPPKAFKTTQISSKLASTLKTRQDYAGERPVNIDRVRVQSRQDFDALLVVREPAVIEGLEIGKCVETWNDEYLKQKIGADRQVTVHVSKEAKMSFLDKNFTYAQKPFNEFLDGVSRGEKNYLRAISSTKPSERATRLRDDFPSIAADFQLPPELASVTESEHSSPLRISGPVALWLHYDVKPNVLCQIRGVKRLLLFAPWEVDNLDYPPGSSSSRLNAWDEWEVEKSNLRYARAYEAILRPGDVLYIPALWSHTASPSEGMSIAINVFFGELNEGYVAGRDVYGNRDVQAYENGRKDVERIIKSFSKLPEQFGQFYLQRLANELASAAQANAGEGFH